MKSKIFRLFRLSSLVTTTTIIWISILSTLLKTPLVLSSWLDWIPRTFFLKTAGFRSSIGLKQKRYSSIIMNFRSLLCLSATGLNEVPSKKTRGFGGDSSLRLPKVKPFSILETRHTVRYLRSLVRDLVLLIYA